MQKGVAIILGVIGIGIILLAVFLGSWGGETKTLEYEVTYTHGERAGYIGFDLDITIENVDDEGGEFTVSASVEADNGQNIEAVGGAPVPYPGAMPSEDDIQFGDVRVHIEAGHSQTVYLTFAVPPEPVEIVHVYYDVDSTVERDGGWPALIGKTCGILLGIGLLFFSVVLYFSPELPEDYLAEYERKKWEKRERAKIGNLTCLYCGKVCKTGGGRAAHERACSENPKNKPSENTD